jgi:hypothetical protein
MQRLSLSAFARAKQFVFRHGRPLDQQRFQFYFESGPAAAVLAELARYQNEDGGFGNALEPDIRSSSSSVIATATALGHLRAMKATSAEPMVQRAVRYLLGRFDAQRQVWAMVTAAVEEAPHAPWWTYAEIEQNFSGFLINPTVGIVASLYDYPDLAPAAWLRDLGEVVVARLEQSPDKMDLNDFHVALDLAEAAHLSGDLRTRVGAVLRRVIDQTVEHDPAQWGNYVLQPLAAAPRPDSLLAPLIDRNLIETNLDYLVANQTDDGAWPLAWNWAFVDAAAWAQAEREWRGMLAVNHLRTLLAFGRIEGL